MCVWRINRAGHVVLGDHLSHGCSSSLSCSVSSPMLALPDTDHTHLQSTLYIPIVNVYDLYSVSKPVCPDATHPGPLVFHRFPFLFWGKQILKSSVSECKGPIQKINLVDLSLCPFPSSSIQLIHILIIVYQNLSLFTCCQSTNC